MKIAFVYRLDFNNPGDLWSSPYHYIGKPGMLLDVFNPIVISNFDALIVGGGAIIQNPRMKNNLNNLLDMIPGPKIFWGGGTVSPEDFNPLLAKFDLVGCRDHGTKFQFLPCSSVMHPLFSSKKKSTKNFLIIDHWKTNPIEFSLPHTRIKNRFISIEDIIRQINDHEYVITSSYHGAYWSILQGKKVIVIVNDIPGKFNFKHNIILDSSWKDEFFDTACNYPDAYEEYLDINKKFLIEVNSIIY